MGVLDNNGLLYLWTKIKNTFVAKEDGKGLSTNDYTTAEKEKLAGIAAGANKTTIANSLTSTSTSSALSAAQGKALKELIDAKGDMLKSVYDTDGDGIVDNAEKVNGHTVGCDVPADAVFTDTTYNENNKLPASAIQTSPGALFVTDSEKVQWNNSKNVVTSVEPSGAGAGGLVCITLADGTKYYTFGSKTYGDTIVANWLPLAGELSNGIITREQYQKIETLEETYAKKEDLTNVYTYKGSVVTADDLPAYSDVTVGDVYDIQTASQYGDVGTNVAWNGRTWDSLGTTFKVTEITNAEIDTICV